MMTIPVFGVPVLNRGDLLTRLFLSIDYPVDQFVIVNNGRNESVSRSIDLILRKHANVEVLTHEGNAGVAASWNEIIQRFPAPLHFICSNDIQFQRGDLNRMIRAVRPQEDLILLGNCEMAFFILTEYGRSIGGLFDENFYPAYYEDCDWMRRVRILGKDQTNVPNITAIHGEDPTWGSSTIYSNKEYRQKNNITHYHNGQYYRRKWGGSPCEETFTNPFNDPNWPVDRWVIEEDRFQQLHIW